MELSRLEDLKAFLQAKLGLRVSVEDLKTANAESVQKIYLTFLKFFNFRTENFHQIPFRWKVPDPDMYQDTMAFVALTSSMEKIIKTSGSTINFHLGDVLDPKPKKFKNILTHLCHLSLFWESRMDLFEPVKMRYENRKQLEQKMDDESEELKCVINQLQHEINEMEERLEKEDDPESKLEEMQHKKNKFLKEKEITKGIKEEVSIRLAAIIQEQISLPGEIESFKSQLRQPLVETEKELQEWEANASKWEEKCNDLRQRELQSDYVQLEQLSTKFEEIVKGYNQQCGDAKNLLNCTRNLPNIQKTIEATKNEIMDTEKSISQEEEILNMLKQQNEKQLWRRQCQIEEKNAILAEKESLQVGGETVAEMQLLNELAAKSLRDMKLEEEKRKSFENDFSSNFVTLTSLFKDKHKQNMNEYDCILRNIDNFYGQC